LRGRAVACSET